MDAPTAPIDPQLITDARERAGVQLRDLNGIPQLSVDAACERAALAMERYCAGLLDELVTTVFVVRGVESVSRITKHYADLALDFAKSIRDLEPDAPRRHALAQVVQNKVLESERRLRLVLNAFGPLTRPSDPTNTNSMTGVSSPSGT